MYDLLREKPILTLLSINTIYSYTGTSNGKVGVTEPMKRRLNMISEGLGAIEKVVSLQVDEIHLRQLLVYLNPTQRLVGEVDYGDVDLSRGENYNKQVGNENATTNGCAVNEINEEATDDVAAKERSGDRKPT